MKHFLLTAAALLFSAAALLAQDELPAVRKAVEAENRKVLSDRAARPVVVAQQRVPRKDFHLWLSPLKEGRWGTDANWYPARTTRLYLSRPAADGNSDIVWSELLETTWSAPAPLCEAAVSPGSEIFPMLSPDGKRIYFASDGLFGMGGYDLYEASWDERHKTWGKVRNLGLPFNSPGDDLLFCDTPDGRYSLLVSNRACSKDSVVIYVLRQETPVYAAVTPDEAAKLSALAVTEPESGFILSKALPGRVPALSFEEPEDTFDYTLRVGKEGAFAPDNKLPSGQRGQSGVCARPALGQEPVCGGAVPQLCRSRAGIGCGAARRLPVCLCHRFRRRRAAVAFQGPEKRILGESHHRGSPYRQVAARYASFSLFSSASAASFWPKLL